MRWELKPLMNDSINGGQYRQVRDENRQWIADVPVNDARQQGVASLIAAAPDLLSACKTALDSLEYDEDKDERDPKMCWCTDTGTDWGDGVLRCAPCRLRQAIAKAEGK